MAGREDPDQLGDLRTLIIELETDSRL